MRASQRTVTVFAAAAGVVLAGGLAFADGAPPPPPDRPPAAAADHPTAATSAIELPTGDPDPQRPDAPGGGRAGNGDRGEDRRADGGRAAPAIANEYLRESATPELLEACREANGTNKNRANWRGKLVSAVARELRGRTFGPDEEHVVTDDVEDRC
ncbi:hypothetical protein V5H98_05930 [Georgenia sp. M64]|uniref:hypothetical protein n=1 Tax=Georgenia sp. M64 TaxID=3120520 RepID=UPI0030E195F4